MSSLCVQHGMNYLCRSTTLLVFNPNKAHLIQELEMFLYWYLVE